MTLSANNKKIRKWLRNTHRDLGYLFVGVILIYAISGILLNHKISAYSTQLHEFQIEKQLSESDLQAHINSDQSNFKLNKIIPSKGGYQLFIDGGVGEYNTQTGSLNIETYKRNIFIDFVHKLHYNTINGWKYIADVFAVSLIFFAISGLFLSRGKKSVSGRGKWLIIAGVVITILFCVF